MNETVVQAALLGFAHGHVLTYTDEWQKAPELGVKVVAGWDHDAKRLASTSKSLGIEPFASVESLLAKPEITAVVVGAETSLHAELVEKAANAGKAIILQKPMALTMQEADRIVAAVEVNGVPFTLAWQMRVDPQNIKMKQMIDDEELGKVLFVRRKHGLAMGLSADFADSWHVDPEYNRDIWADDAAHPIDLLHWWLGVPETVSAEIASLYQPRIPMDNGTAMFRYDEGPLAEVSCSFTCAASENTTEIICERGTIIQNYGEATSCNVPRPDDAVGLKWYRTDTKQWEYSDIATPPNHSFRIRGLAKPLADFLHGKRAPIATAEEGRTSLRMMLACYVSNGEGRRVRLDDVQISSFT